jgi:mRNA interferase MazF
MALSQELRRGDIVTLVVSGDYGKPRAALIVQADSFNALPSVTVLRISSELRDAPLIRLALRPDPDNGLRDPSQIMVDKAITVPRSKLGYRIGRIESGLMRSVDSALLSFLGLQQMPVSIRRR